MTAAPGMSVVIATAGRASFVRDCVDDLVRQAHRPLEILVIDQSDVADGVLTDLATASDELLTYRHVSTRNLPAARNLGWQLARHEFVLFVDDDVRCGADLVAEHLRTLATGAAAVAGAIDERNGTAPPRARPGRFSRWTADLVRGFDADREADVDHAPGGNLSTRRALLAELGGFDEALGVNPALYEEADFCLRLRAAGHRIVFNPRARLRHLAAPSGGCREPDMRRYVRVLGRNRAAIIRRHLRWFEASTALPRLAILGLAYARHYRDPGLLTACLRGARDGWRVGGRAPICTAVSP